MSPDISHRRHCPCLQGKLGSRDERRGIHRVWRSPLGISCGARKESLRGAECGVWRLGISRGVALEDEDQEVGQSWGSPANDHTGIEPAPLEGRFGAALGTHEN